jgi:hypothetical protein
VSEDLYRLVYYSRNRSSGDVGAEIEAILAASRRNNAMAGVTGALLFNSGCFGQVLEGNRRAVEATFERIQCDARHGDVSLLAFERVAARAFGNWSMAFVGNRRADAERYAAIAAASGFDASHITGDRLFEVLQRLALEEEDWAA